MIYLLISHIIIGALLVVTFIARYVGLLTHKITAKTGRPLMAGLSVALMSSGVALVFVAHSPITSSCITFLELIAVIGALELGLYGIGSKAEAKK